MGHFDLALTYMYYLFKQTIKSSVILEIVSFPKLSPNSVTQLECKRVYYESISQEFKSCWGFQNFYLSKKILNLFFG